MQGQIRPHQILAEMTTGNRTDNGQSTTSKQSTRGTTRESTEGTTTEQIIAAQKPRMLNIATDATTESQDTGHSIVLSPPTTNGTVTYATMKSNRGDSRDRNNLKMRVVNKNRASPYKKNGNPKNNSTVTARLLSPRAPASKAQSNIIDSHNEYQADFGREDVGEKSPESQRKKQDETKIDINRKIIDCNQTLPEAELNKLYSRNHSSPENRVEKPSPDML
ncbi:hypothetical protein TKK_0000166 [Trichogramma kaykai]